MKYLKYIAIIFALLILGVGYANAHVARLALIGYSGFHSIGGNVYLSQSIPDSAKKEIPSLLQNARDRIASQYGEPLASPVIVVLGGDSEQRSYGLYGTPGAMMFAPWESYVLLNYETAEISVVAHELVHAEITHRVGYVKRQLSIPTWFDEGAAMQVDYRESYPSHGAINLDEFYRVVGLDTPNKFWAGDRDQHIANYRSVKMAFAEILNSADIELYSVLEKIKEGENGIISTTVNETNKALQRTSR